MNWLYSSDRCVLRVCDFDRLHNKIENRKCLHNDVNLMKEDQTNVIDFPLYDNPDIVV